MRLAACLTALVLAACHSQEDGRGSADPRNAEQVALGAKLYAVHCASCHGANLQGHPSWRERLPNGRMPAPPHDESGHTWHHTDEVLFGITKEGLVQGKYAPPGYVSDMPAFAHVLSDAEIWAVLAYIKSRWKTPALLEAREEILRNAKRR